MELFLIIVAIPPSNSILGYFLRYIGNVGEIIPKLKSSKTVTLVFLAPTREELVFRGIPLLLTESLLSAPFLLSIALFTYFHKRNYAYGFVWIMPLFVLGAIILSYIATKFGLMWAIVAHIVNNLYAKLWISWKER